MSRASIRAEMAENIKFALSSEANKKLRRNIQGRGRPQVIRLQNLDFINDTIEELIAGGKERKQLKKVDFSDADVKAAQNLAKPYQDRFIASRQNTLLTINKIEDTLEFLRLKDVRPEIAQEIIEGTSFIVVSFGVLRTLKSQIVDTVLKKKTKEVRKRIKTKIDRGHGTEGGDAVSSIQIAEAAGLASQEGLDLSKVPGLDKYLLDAFSSVEYIDNPVDLVNIVKEVIIDYQTLVGPNGKLKAEYIPVITFQDYFSNRRDDAKVEKFVLSTVRSFFDEAVAKGTLVNMSGSKSIKDNIETVIVNNLLGKKKKNVKVSRRLDDKVDTSKKRAATETTKAKKAKTKNTKPTSKAFAGAKRTKKRTRDNVISFPQLFAILQSRINTVVARNMGSPALNYRTGRFASSVKITDVTPTTQGFPSVGYTYMKSPYQTFEPGFRQGSPDRDPRKLIDKSIREIAGQLVVGRLYTRRL